MHLHSQINSEKKIQKMYVIVCICICVCMSHLHFRYIALAPNHTKMHPLINIQTQWVIVHITFRVYRVTNAITDQKPYQINIGNTTVCIAISIHKSQKQKSVVLSIVFRLAEQCGWNSVPVFQKGVIWKDIFQKGVTISAWVNGFRLYSVY